MPTDPRLTAIECLRELHRCLSQSPDDPSDYIGQAERLLSAVESSHMEAIRFQLFGLRRQFKADTQSLPEQAVSLLDSTAAALRDAGFRT